MSTHLDSLIAAPLKAVASVATHIQDRAPHADGRRRTRRTLASLERSGWEVTHNVSVPSGSRVDHLLVGPCGVFILDSRAWNGVVTVDNKGATITPRNDPGAAWVAYGHHRALPPAAAAVVRSLAAVTGGPIGGVRAVVVVWATFPERVVASGSVTYVAGEHLVEWLSTQPHSLDGSGLRALRAVDLSTLVPTQLNVSSADRDLQAR